jgi:hypothetical protein
MRKLHLLFIWGCLAAFIVTSCKKADDAMAKSANLKSLTASGITLKNGVLIFPDQVTLQSTIEGLDAQQQKAIAAFSASLPADVTPDKAKEIATAQGYDENQTFINFEKQNGFHSMRVDFEAAVNTWAANGLNNADPNNPFTYYASSLYPLLTILNSSGTVGVGKELYKIMRNGVVYEIIDGSFQTLEGITDANMDAQFKAANVVIHNPELLGQRNTRTNSNLRSNVCTSWAYAMNNFNPYNNGGTPHLDDQIMVRNFWIVSYVQAQAINWDQGGGNWTRQPCNIRSGFEEKECNCPTLVNTSLNQDCGYLYTSTHSCTQYWWFHTISVQGGNLHTNTYIWGGNWTSTIREYNTYL